MPRRHRPRVPRGGHVVPCELDGERILALVATGTSEVLIDTNSRHEAAWVNLRFDRVEVKDVPALVQDLAPITRQLGVPIKALIGAQLLRHAHATFDRRGDQFVVRRQDAPAPPDASRVPLYYVRGGGMMLRATITAKQDDPIPLLVDSSRPFPLFLQDVAWKKAGIDVQSLAGVPDSPNMKHGVVPMFRMGGFDLAKLPAIAGGDFSEMANGVDINLAGVVGADLLSFFRVTFADDGRFMWNRAGPDAGRPRAAAGWSAPDGPPFPSAPGDPTSGALADEQSSSLARLAVYAGASTRRRPGTGPHRARVGALQRRHRGHRPSPDAEPALSVEERIDLPKAGVGAPDERHRRGVRRAAHRVLQAEEGARHRARAEGGDRLRVRAAGIAHANADLEPDVDTVFLPTRTKNGFISASLVREIASHGGDVSRYAPALVCEALARKSPGLSRAEHTGEQLGGADARRARPRPSAEGRVVAHGKREHGREGERHDGEHGGRAAQSGPPATNPTTSVAWHAAPSTIRRPETTARG